MKVGMFFAIAATALLGASCSVQDFSTKVMDKPAVTASLPTSYEATITQDDYTRYYGKYSFRYGYLSNNMWNPAELYAESTYYIAKVPLLPSTTYTISHHVNGYGAVQTYDASDNSIAYFLGYETGTTFTTASNVAYALFQMSTPTGSSNGLPRLNLGSSVLEYQPYAYGFSFDTPVTGAGSCAMDIYWSDGAFVPRNPSLAFNYFDECKLYTDGYKFDFGGNSDLQSRFLAEWLGSYASGTHRGFEGWDQDYDGNYLIMVPLVEDYAQGAFCEFYIHDRYDAGFEDASNLLYGGIFKDARYVTLTYTKTGGAFASVHYDGFNEAFAAFRPYMYNGLLGVNEWLYNNRGGTLLPDWDGSSDVGLIVDYSPDPVSIVGTPLYIDVDVSVDNPDSSNCTYFTPMLTDSTTPMTLNFNRSFKGLVTDYYSYDSRYTVFGRYSFMFPAQPVQCLTNYVGVVSSYAAGYLDGVNSRNAEISDLSQRIIDLQSELSGYNGMTYDQIYELGRQAGINAGNAANSMMSGLFGAILSVPLSIFGGLGQFSVLGVSVMSLIVSLLVVAVAVMVLKRFL